MHEHYGARFFGGREAAVYDDQAADMFDDAVVRPTVAMLAELAGGMGIGTGRIALPLAAGGVRVHGIDASEAMVARLRGKPGAEAIDVTIGDFASTVLARLPCLQHHFQPGHPG
ncbi:MAG: class I SAM-dependent methyltransferase [Candidatus Dormibacter sp.]